MSPPSTSLWCLLYIMKKRREVKIRGQNMVRWGMWRDNVAMKYKERVRPRYEELNKEVEGLEEQCREVFWGNYRSFVLERHQERVHRLRVETRYDGRRKWQK